MSEAISKDGSMIGPHHTYTIPYFDGVDIDAFKENSMSHESSTPDSISTHISEDAYSNS